MLRDPKARSARRRREIAQEGGCSALENLARDVRTPYQYLETSEHRDTDIEETVAALAHEPGGALADPGNEILNAKRNCSRYIVLERAAMQGASSENRD